MKPLLGMLAGGKPFGVSSVNVLAAGLNTSSSLSLNNFNIGPPHVLRKIIITVSALRWPRTQTITCSSSVGGLSTTSRSNLQFEGSSAYGRPASFLQDIKFPSGTETTISITTNAPRFWYSIVSVIGGEFQRVVENSYEFTPFVMSNTVINSVNVPDETALISSVAFVSKLLSVPIISISWQNTAGDGHGRIFQNIENATIEGRASSAHKLVETGSSFDIKATCSYNDFNRSDATIITGIYHA